MKTFNEFLLEARVDDLKKSNPDIADSIDKYNAIDPSPTKKYLPWLVKQHKGGYLDDVSHDDIKSTLTRHMNNPSKLKPDIGVYNYEGLKSDVDKNTTDTKTEKKTIANKNLEKIHDADGVQAFHVKTRAAAIRRYGHGKEQGTHWCVAADSEDNAFGNYGKHMFGIEKKGDPNSPYAYHPENEHVAGDGGSITTGKNDGERPTKDVVTKNPWMKPIIDKARPIVAKAAEENKRGIEFENKCRYGNDQSIISKALDKDHPHPFAAEIAAGNKNASEGNLIKALGHDNPDVALSAASNTGKNVNDNVLNKAIKHPHSYVRRAAYINPVASEAIMKNGIDHRDDAHGWAVMENPNITKNILTRALGHKDERLASYAQRRLQHGLYGSYNRK